MSVLYSGRLLNLQRKKRRRRRKERKEFRYRRDWGQLKSSESCFVPDSNLEELLFTSVRLITPRDDICCRHPQRRLVSSAAPSCSPTITPP
ncbi:hypothetical protein CDAR_598471 [Caerostris darwini]|uniref:Uncharacterized protein n=1 Tax=Caerostris darwini TaxID=1538125 RepID=A0AAV4QJN1_9ARAC|nr:hypothetical protein CDAR_598471 [Caerostris darwini]